MEGSRGTSFLHAKTSPTGDVQFVAVPCFCQFLLLQITNNEGEKLGLTRQIELFNLLASSNLLLLASAC